jgi:hypothetical protein
MVRTETVLSTVVGFSCATQIDGPHSVLFNIKCSKDKILRKIQLKVHVWHLFCLELLFPTPLLYPSKFSTFLTS